MPPWHRLLVVGSVIAVTLVAAKLIDRRIARRPFEAEAVTRYRRRIARRPFEAEAVTRYRVLRRSITTVIVAVGLLSALLVIPQVRAVAGGILASSAIVGLVVGFASRSTLANFVAGLLIAFTQPLRLGDTVEISGVTGVVEEIGLTYTFIRARDGDRLVIPNEKLASDTILNSTIVSREKLAEITLQVSPNNDLGAVVDLLQTAVAGRPGSEVLVSALNDSATITVRAGAGDELAVERVQSDLRVLAHGTLRSAGVYS